MEYQKYDSALLGILQNEGGLPKFLDAIFGFLYRRTDYYVHLTPEGRMGFPPGVAKKLALTAFKRYEELAAKDFARREAMRIQAEQKLQQQLEQTPSVPDCIRVEEVSTSEEVSTTDDVSEEIKSSSSLNTPVQLSSTAEEEKESNVAGHITTAPPSMTNSSSSQSQDQLHTTVSSDTDSKVISSSVEPELSSDVIHTSTVSKDNTSSRLEALSASTAPDEDDEEQTKLQRIFQANSESYNGAIRDKYSWAQSITDVDIRVKVPKHIVKGKDVTVEINRKHLKSTFKDSHGTVVVAVDDSLSWEINKEESIWSLVPGEHIHINLEKCEERWWESLLVSEPKISVRKIDPSRPMTDLDDGAQAKIEEMMYNEQQKRLGLPQTHEKKVHDMLRQAWDTEGSPFKGQPFDPSQINISPNSMG